MSRNLRLSRNTQHPNGEKHQTDQGNCQFFDTVAQFESGYKVRDFDPDLEYGIAETGFRFRISPAMRDDAAVGLDTVVTMANIGTFTNTTAQGIGGTGLTQAQSDQLAASDKAIAGTGLIAPNNVPLDPSKTIQKQINDTNTEILNLQNLVGESLTIGNGVTPAIPTANLANWKTNTAYQFNADVVIAPIALSDGTNQTNFEQGSTLKIVKTGASSFGYQLIDARDNIPNSIYVTVGAAGSDYVVANTANATTEIQAAIDYANSLQNGATVLVKEGDFYSDQLIWKAKVNIKGSGLGKTRIIARANLNDDLIITQNFNTETNTNFLGYSTMNRNSIRDISLIGNRDNQTIQPVQAESRDYNYLVKFYGWLPIFENVEFDDCEGALYTEYSNNQPSNPFESYELFEGRFVGLRGKNYARAGWVFRGPHDSHISDVKFSGGLNDFPDHHLLADNNGNYGGQGSMLDDVHLWGNTSTTGYNAVIKVPLNGTLYAEGSTNSNVLLQTSGSDLKILFGFQDADNNTVNDGALILKSDAGLNVNNNTVEVIAYYGPVNGDLVRLEAPAGAGQVNVNSIKTNIKPGATVSGSEYKLVGNINGNHLVAGQGQCANIWDLLSYTGTNNSFITESRKYRGGSYSYFLTAFTGDYNENSDYVDVWLDAFPDFERLHIKNMPETGMTDAEGTVKFANGVRQKYLNALMPDGFPEQNAPVGKTKQLASITVKTADAYQARCLLDIQRWRAWAGDDVNLLIGEIGFPTDRTGQDAKDWGNLAEAMYSACTAYNIGHWTWATGQAWSAGYNAKAYRLTAGVWSDTYLSPIIEKYAGNDMCGINWASLEFGVGVAAPTLADLSYHKAKGWNKIRLPIKLSDFTDWDTGIFNTNGQARYQRIIDTMNRCQKLGIQVMLDVHMYATWSADVDTPTNILNAANRAGWYKAYDLLLNTQSPDANDSIVKLKDHPALFMFDLMNEPAAISESAWIVESQLLLEHLRNSIKFDRWITVGLPQYSGMISLPRTNNMAPWIVDPLAKIYYQAHIYFDYTNSSAGRYWANPPTNTVPTLYSDELAAAVTANQPTNVSLSNTKGLSTAKLLGSEGFIRNGGTTHTATVAVPANTTKAIIAFSMDGAAGITPTAVTFNGVTCDQIAFYPRGFGHTAVYSIENPVGTSVSVTTSAATNVNILVQYWDGLKSHLEIGTYNVTNNTLFGGLFHTNMGVAKSKGSVLINYAFVNNSVGSGTPQTITERNVNLDNPIIPAGSLVNPTVNAGFSYSIKSQYSQIGEPTIVNFQNQWQAAGSKIGIVLELPTDTYEIVEPGSFYDANVTPSSNFPAQVPQIQPDYNQTNSAALDYIKNKPVEDYLITQDVDLRERQGKMVTSFQSGHGWTRSLSGTGTLTDDTSIFALGDQSLKFVSGGVFETVRNFALTAFDATDKDFQVWIRLESDVTNLSNLQFQVGDAFLANNYSWNLTGYKNYIGTGKFTKIRLPWSDAVVTGTAPDIGNLSQAQFVIQSNASTSSTVYLGGVSLLDKNTKLPNGAVCFTFDDSYVEHYTVAKPILDKYGYSGTAFTVIEAIEGSSPTYMRLQNLKDMEKNSGWQISGHATTFARHVPWSTLTNDVQAEEIAANKRWLIENGFKGAEYLAYPNGNYNDYTLFEMQKRFKGARATLGSFETSYPSNPYILRSRISTDQAVTVASMTGNILKAYNNGDIVNITVHKISNTVGALNIIPADFEVVVDYCATLGIPVLTMAQALEAGETKQKQVDWNATSGASQILNKPNYNIPLNLNDLPTGGLLVATTTVLQANPLITINQTTAGQTITIPPYNGQFSLINKGTASIILGGNIINPDSRSHIITCNGTAVTVQQPLNAIPDTNFGIVGDADPTKVIKFNADSISTTGLTKTLNINTPSGATGTLPLQETSNTFANNQTFNVNTTTFTNNAQTVNVINSNTAAAVVEARGKRTVFTGTANTNPQANILIGNKITATGAANNTIIDRQFVPNAGLDFPDISSDCFRNPDGVTGTYYLKSNGDMKVQNLFVQNQTAVAATSSTTVTKGILTIWTGVTAGNHNVTMPNHTQLGTSGIITGADFAGGSHTVDNRRFDGADTVTLTASAGATFRDGFQIGLATLVIQAGEIVTLQWRFTTAGNGEWVVVNHYNSSIQEIVATIDLLTTGLKTLFIAPTGRYFEIEDLKLIPVNITGTVSTFATASLDAATVGGVYSSRSLTSFNGLSEVYPFENVGVKEILQPTIPLNLNVTVASAGAGLTAHTVKAILKIRCVG